MNKLFDIESTEESGNNDWYTPAIYIEAARAVMGGIDLDPASCELANRVVKASRIYTKETNGLAHAWIADSLWLNPPYAKDENGQSNLERWVRYLLAQVRKGNTKQAILLVPMTQATSWFDLLWDYPQCFPPKRIHFWTDGVNDWRPRFSSSFAYLGPNEARFTEVFSKFGRIVRAIDTPAPRPVMRELWQEVACD